MGTKDVKYTVSWNFYQVQNLRGIFWNKPGMPHRRQILAIARVRGHIFIHARCWSRWICFSIKGESLTGNINRPL